jgi:hypothetical protein
MTGDRDYQRSKARLLRALRGGGLHRTERRPCEHCGKPVGLYVPAGGDGSVVVYRFHRDVRTGERCRLVRQVPPSEWAALHQ